MFQLVHNYNHLTYQQNHVQNSPVRLQQYVNGELPDVQAGFRKGRGTRDQIASICWIIERAKDFQKRVYFCFIDYAKAFNYVDHNKLWKVIKEMRMSDTLSASCETCMQVKKQQLELYMNQLSGSKLGKEYNRLCIVTLLILLIHRVHHVKCRAGWITSWNQVSWEKYQQSQICGWYHANSRKQRRTKEPLDEDERGEWKSCPLN